MRKPLVICVPVEDDPCACCMTPAVPQSRDQHGLLALLDLGRHLIHVDDGDGMPLRNSHEVLGHLSSCDNDQART